MKKRVRFVSLLFKGSALLCAAFYASFADSATTPQVSESTVASAVQLGNAFEAIIDSAKRSVVSVLSEKFIKSGDLQSPFALPFEDPLFRQFFGRPPERAPGKKIPISGLGSGFVLDQQGHILTNNHVVEGMEKIHVVLPDKQTFEAKILGTDAKTDIAVLQLKGDYPKNLETARLGDSTQLKTGHFVLAFGAPFGLTQTVTSGIVSATGRSDVGIATFEDFIQTDAPINPGNSGGPLVNMHAEVVGITTAIATNVGQSAGVGFAIPINMAKEILPVLLKGKAVVRGMLGVAVQDITPSLKKQFHLSQQKGALVSQVNEGSPGEKAGIKAGDVILKFGGKPVEDSRQLRAMVSKDAPGTQEEVTLLRNGKEMRVIAQLGDLRSQAEQTASAQGGQRNQPLESFGIEATNLTPQLKSQLNLKENKGIVITDVDEASPAGLAGLQPGDLILEVDRKKVDSVNQANAVLAKSTHHHEALFLVSHGGEAAYVTLEVG